MKPALWLLSYDIGDAKRWRQVVKLAQSHGDRVQKSLFACGLHREQRDALAGALKQVATMEDRIALRPVCAACRAGERWQGKGRQPERGEPFWVV